MQSPTSEVAFESLDRSDASLSPSRLATGLKDKPSGAVDVVPMRQMIYQNRLALPRPTPFVCLMLHNNLSENNIRVVRSIVEDQRWDTERHGASLPGSIHQHEENVSQVERKYLMLLE